MELDELDFLTPEDIDILYALILDVKFGSIRMRRIY